jgi:ribonuclease D
MYKPDIITEEILELELSAFGGEIVLVDNMDTFYKVINRLKEERVLGFDTETKPTFKRGQRNKVALVQLSTSNLAVLFRVNRIGLPPELLSILSNQNIIKAGVAVHDDLRLLKNIRKFNPAGFAELQNIVKEFGIQISGLKKLVAIILGFRISKRQQVTDWEANELSEAQLLYAATDAWVCYEIYRKLLNGN